MNPAPNVCIIVTTYNRASLVARSVDSVLSQTYSRCTVIVVDDGSSDETPAALQQYAAETRVHLVRHAQNRGVTAAKNTGLGLLPDDTDYFGILDSDDILLPDAVGSLVGVFEATGDAYSQVMGWYRDTAGTEISGHMTYREGEVSYLDALCGRFRGDFWKLFRRDMLGGRRFDERASGGEVCVWWPMLKEKPGWLIPDVIGLVDTSGSDRISVRGFSPTEAEPKMWAYHAVLEAVGPDMRRMAPRQFASANVEMAKWAALAGRRGLARRASWDAFRARPSARSILIGLLALAPTSMARRVANARTAVRTPVTG